MMQELRKGEGWVEGSHNDAAQTTAPSKSSERVQRLSDAEAQLGCLQPVGFDDIARTTEALDVSPDVMTALCKRDDVIQFGRVWFDGSSQFTRGADAAILAAPPIAFEDGQRVEGLAWQVQPACSPNGLCDAPFVRLFALVRTEDAPPSAGNRGEGLSAFLASTRQASVFRSVLCVPLTRLLAGGFLPAFVRAIPTAAINRDSADMTDLRSSSRFRRVRAFSGTVLPTSKLYPIRLDCERPSATETRAFGTSAAVVSTFVRAVRSVAYSLFIGRDVEAFATSRTGRIGLGRFHTLGMAFSATRGRTVLPRVAVHEVSNGATAGKTLWGRLKGHLRFLPRTEGVTPRAVAAVLGLSVAQIIPHRRGADG